MMWDAVKGRWRSESDSRAAGVGAPVLYSESVGETEDLYGFTRRFRSIQVLTIPAKTQHDAIVLRSNVEYLYIEPGGSTTGAMDDCCIPLLSSHWVVSEALMIDIIRVDNRVDP